MMEDIDEDEVHFDQEGLLDRKKKPNKYTQWCHNMVKIICLSLAFLSLGLCIAVPGPTLLDLQDHINTDTSHMTLIFSARSVGYLCGALFGGFLFDIFDKQLLLCATLFLASIATAIIPWSLTLAVLAVMFSVQGLAMGVLDTGGNTFCVKIWGRRSSPYMQAMHFAFGIGAFIAPILSQPFLSQDLPSTIQGNIPVNVDIEPFLNQLHNTNYSEHHRMDRDVSVGQNTTAIPASSTLQDFMTNINTSYSTSDNENLTLTTTPTVPPIITIATTPMPKKPHAATDDHLSGANEHLDGGVLNNAHKDKKNPLKPPEDHVHVNLDTRDKVTINSTIEPNDNNNATESVLNVNITGTASAGNQTVPTSTAGTTTMVTTTATKQSTTTSTTTQPPTTTTSTQSTTTTTPPPTTTTVKTTTQPMTTTTVPIISTKGESVDDTVDDKNKDKNRPNEDTKNTEMKTTTEGIVTTESVHTTLPVANVTKPKTVGNLLQSAVDAVKHMSKIQFTYMIIAALLMINCAIFLVLYCCDRKGVPYQPSLEDRRKMYHVDNSCVRASILVIMFLFFLAYVGMETTFGGLIMTFTVEYMDWTKKQGTIVTSIFWGSLAVGRGMSIFIAGCCKPRTMLIIDLFFMVVGATMLSFVVHKFDFILWVGTLLLGLGMSSVFPAGISWTEQYFHMTGKSTAVLVTGSALGQMMVPAATGYVFQKKSEMYLMYIVLILSIACVILYTLMQLLASKCGRRTSNLPSHNGFMPLNTTTEDNYELDGYGTTQGDSSHDRLLGSNGYDRIPLDDDYELD